MYATAVPHYSSTSLLLCALLISPRHYCLSLSGNQAHALTRVGRSNTFRQSIMLWPATTTVPRYSCQLLLCQITFHAILLLTLAPTTAVPYYDTTAPYKYFILLYPSTVPKPLYLSANHAHALGRVGECDVRAPGEVCRRFLHPVVNGKGAARIRPGWRAEAQVKRTGLQAVLRTKQKKKKLAY